MSKLISLISGLFSLSSLKGYRTYLFGSGTVLLSLSATLTVIATFAGTLPIEYGISIAAVCAGLAQGCAALGQVFQRAATADAAGLIQLLEEKLASLLAEREKPVDMKIFGGQLKLNPADDFLGTVNKSLERVEQSLNIPTPAEVAAAKQAVADQPAFPAINMLLACLLLCGTAAAADVVSIVGPSGVQAAGLPCSLHLEGLDSKKAVAIHWSVYPKVVGVTMIEAREGGKIGRLTTISGTWLVTAQYHYDGEEIRETEPTVIHVPGVPYVTPIGPVPAPPAPPVPPNPTPPVPTPVPVPPVPTPPMPTPPGPTPDVVLPAGEFGELPKLVREAASKIESSNRVAEARQLASAAEGLAAQIAAGTLSDNQLIANSMAGEIAKLGAAWKPFSLAVGTRLKLLYLGGKLNSAERWAVLLREAAVGLNAVK